MLLTLSLTFYAALGGATFSRGTRYLDLIERRGARAKWLLLCLLAALLWPLTWGVLAVIRRLARDEPSR